MKLSRLFAILSIIALLTISEGAMIVHAEILTKDFGESDFNSSDGGVFCKMGVTATIQTEPNGNWIVNNTYEVNWTIRITYLNQSIYDSSDDFSIVFYDPVNPIYDNVPKHTVIYETTVTPQNSGTLSVTFKPSSAPMTFELDSAFGLKVFYKGQIRTSGSWQQDWQNEPIQISVENSQSDSVNPSIDPIYAYALMIAVVIIAIGIGIFAYTKRKNKSQ